MSKSAEISKIDSEVFGGIFPKNSCIDLAREFDLMEEDIEITNEIIGFFAKQNSFPVNITLGSLAQELGRQGEISKVGFHLKCAIDAGLIVGDYRRVATFGAVHYSFGFIDGLTKDGSDYYKATQVRIWDRAKKWCLEKGVPLSTKALLKYINSELS